MTTITYFYENLTNRFPPAYSLRREERRISTFIHTLGMIGFCIGAGWDVKVASEILAGRGWDGVMTFLYLRSLFFIVD